MSNRGMGSRIGHLEKRAADLERREREKLLKRLVEVATNEELRQLEAAPAVAEIFGAAPEEVVGARGGVDAPMTFTLNLGELSGERD